MVLTLTRLNGSVNGHLNWDMEENGHLDLKLLQLNPQDKWLMAHVLVDLHLLISPNIPCSLSNTHTHTEREDSLTLNLRGQGNKRQGREK